MKLNELLFKIKENPKLYLRYKTLEGLDSYLNGYLDAFRDHKEDVVQHYNVGELFREFQTFIQNKYNIKSTQSWVMIIRFYCNSDYHAFDKFFKLYEEFLEEYKEFK